MVESAPKQTAADGTRMRWLLQTRPSGRGTELDLADLGIECVQHPLLLTETAAATAALRQQLAQAALLPRRVFVSAAAVAALTQLDSAQLSLPAAAVGASTADLLCAAGCTDVWTAVEQPGIAGLFELPQWESLRGSTAAIYCAPGSRQPAAERLQQLDLKLAPVHVYRREAVPPSDWLLARLRKEWREVVFSATSVELLQQLDELLQRCALNAAKSRPLLVLSARIADQARQMGYTQVAQISHLDAVQITAALAVWQPRG